MPDLSGLAKIIEQYPAFWNQFKNIPEIVQVLASAIDQNWTPERMNAALYNTNYWKTTTESQRAWDQLSAISPGEAQKRQGDKTTLMTQIMSRLGLVNNKGTPDQQTWNWIADVYHVTSQDLNAQQIADYLTVRYSGDPNVVGNQAGAGGEIASNMEKIRGLANDYGLPVNQANALWHAQNIARGIDTIEGIQGTYAQQAKGLFAPEVAKAIDSGKTVRQFADPYITLAAQNLEIGPDQIDLSDPKWQGFLKAPQSDPKQPSRVMTTAEWQAKIRTDPTYGYDKTSTARQAASQLAATLQQTFGAKG